MEEENQDQVEDSGAGSDEQKLSGTKRPAEAPIKFEDDEDDDNHDENGNENDEDNDNRDENENVADGDNNNEDDDMNDEEDKNDEEDDSRKKRKIVRKRYTNTEKYAIIKLMEALHYPKIQIMEHYGLPKTTLNDWLTPAKRQKVIDAIEKDHNLRNKSSYESDLQKLDRPMMAFYEMNAMLPARDQLPMTPEVIRFKVNNIRNAILHRDKQEKRKYLTDRERKAFLNFAGSKSWASKYMRKHGWDKLEEEKQERARIAAEEKAARKAAKKARRAARKAAKKAARKAAKEAARLAEAKANGETIDETTEGVKEETNEEGKKEVKDEIMEDITDDVKKETTEKGKDEITEESKDENKEKSKEDAKEKSKEETKDEGKDEGKVLGEKGDDKKESDAESDEESDGEHGESKKSKEAGDVEDAEETEIKEEPKELKEPKVDPLEKVREKVAQYDPKFVFTVDETFYFYKVLPNRYYVKRAVARVVGATKHMKWKDRFTVYLCCNEAGDFKMPLFTVGKFKNPRCVEGLKDRPAKYLAQEKAWGNKLTFQSWWEFFLEEVREYTDEKVLFVMDPWVRHSADIRDEKGQVEVVMLPPNSGAMPFRMGMTATVKRSARLAYLKKFIEVVKQRTELREASKDMRPGTKGLAQGEAPNILDGVLMVRACWNYLPPEFIQKCWKIAGLRPRDDLQPFYRGKTIDRPIILDDQTRNDFVDVIENHTEELPSTQRNDYDDMIREMNIVLKDPLGDDISPDEVFNKWCLFEDSKEFKRLLTQDIQDHLKNYSFLD